MFLAFSEVNYAAVLLAGGVTFLIGGVWYSALFRNVWLKAHDWSEEKIKAQQAKLPPPVFLGGMFIADTFIAFTMALLMVSLSVKGVENGALFGLVIWAGPAAAIQFTGHLASDRKIAAYFVDISYQFVYLMMMGVLFATWR